MIPEAPAGPVTITSIGRKERCRFLEASVQLPTRCICSNGRLRRQWLDLNQGGLIEGHAPCTWTYRDAALRPIVELCMIANDLEASRKLLRGIQSDPIREELLLAYPDLFR